MEGGLILPDHVRDELQSATAIAATEEAIQRFQRILGHAYYAGYQLAMKTPRRLQAGLNVDSNFWRWYREEFESVEPVAP
jgi:hypothetical protein